MYDLRQFFHCLVVFTPFEQIAHVGLTLASPSVQWLPNRAMEADGLLPIPIFISGVEAHTVVRDLLTSSSEQRRRSEGLVDTPTLSTDCAEVRLAVLRTTAEHVSQYNEAFRMGFGGADNGFGGNSLTS